jgi:hypothetical protein
MKINQKDANSQIEINDLIENAVNNALARQNQNPDMNRDRIQRRAIQPFLIIRKEKN